MSEFAMGSAYLANNAPEEMLRLLLRLYWLIIADGVERSGYLDDPLYISKMSGDEFYQRRKRVEDRLEWAIPNHDVMALGFERRFGKSYR